MWQSGMTYIKKRGCINTPSHNNNYEETKNILFSRYLTALVIHPKKNFLLFGFFFVIVM